MSKLKLFLPLILLVFVLVWAVPELLKAMPDRYVMRLPEPLRQMGLPESHAAILPTVEHPIAVQNLLLTTPDSRMMRLLKHTYTGVPLPKKPALARASSTPASQKSAGTDPIAAPATSIPLPTSTAWPLAVREPVGWFST